MNQVNKNRLILLALCCLAFSGVMVEVTLTKFVTYKVYHHFVYAIVSTVILSLGMAGTVVYMLPRFLGKDIESNWSLVANAAYLSGLTLPLSVLLFVWIPIDPYMPAISPLARILIFPAYFINFAIPFFFSGICISHILAAASLPVRKIFFWDLLAAGLGGALCPILLEALGGYGTICLAAILSLLAFFFLDSLGERRKNAVKIAMSLMLLILVGATLAYPGWAIKQYGFDVRTHKDSDLRRFVLKDFKGISKSYWNAIARIDITEEGTSNEQWFTYTIAQRLRDKKYEGRVVLVDGSAPTRRFKIDGDIRNHPFIGTSLWASPYIVNPEADPSLVIAGGGGIDILIAKYYGIKNVDVVEINPSTYKYVLNGGSEEERRSYQDHLASNERTRVSIYNKEGRHFCSTVEDNHYDVIQASAADTCTAITSGALSLVENYLYTTDSVKEFMRVLKPGGILSLTHWRINPPSTDIRQFNTYLHYLDDIGVKNPEKYLMVLADGEWCDCLIKKAPFTDEEVERVRTWARETDKDILFDPLDASQFSGKPSERIFEELGRANKEERAGVESGYLKEITPVTDDKPYFYGGRNWVRANIQEKPLILFVYSVFVGLLLMILPLFRKDRLKLSGSLFMISLYFAVCGAAFLLYELTVMQMLTIFVGGPMYSMCVVLVSVLIGYGIGSYLAEWIKLKSSTFYFLAFVVPLLLVGLYLLIPILVKTFMPYPMMFRVSLSAMFTLMSAMVVGVSVPCAMSFVRDRYDTAVSWMWGINSAFNGIGAMSFALISESTGISFILIIAAAAYFVANLFFARVMGAAK